MKKNLKLAKKIPGRLRLNLVRTGVCAGAVPRKDFSRLYFIDKS